MASLVCVEADVAALPAGGAAAAPFSSFLSFFFFSAAPAVGGGASLRPPRPALSPPSDFFSFFSFALAPRLTLMWILPSLGSDRSTAGVDASAFSAFSVLHTRTPHTTTAQHSGEGAEWGGEAVPQWSRRG